MVIPRVQCTNEHQNHQHKRVSGSGSGRGEQIRGSNSNGSVRQSSPSTDAVLVSRWSTSGEGLSNSASVPSGVGSATPDMAMPASPGTHHNTKGLHANGKSRGKDGGRVVNETNATLSRSNSLGSSHSQARAQTVNSLRRSSSNTSEAFGSGGGGFGGSSNSTNSAGGPVTASNDPDVLKIEIHRLQAALMNEFKGGNRFIGGAQFKAASNNSRGGHGRTSGNSCGGCMQVCVRGSLFSSQFVDLVGAVIPSFPASYNFLLLGERAGLSCTYFRACRHGSICGGEEGSILSILLVMLRGAVMYIHVVVPGNS